MTTTRTSKQLIDVIRKYIKKWKTNLFLGSWRINFNVRDYLKTGDDGFGTIATCDSSWQYFEATLNFSLEKMANMEEKDIEGVVVHELLHAVVNEMREEDIKHEERVVSQLTMIALWMDKHD